MIEREAPGGQAGMSSRIENYLGFPTGLSGGDLARRAVVQAQRFGVEILSPQEAVGVRTEGSYRIIKLADGSEISCHALMIATGVQWRRLEAPGNRPLAGRGRLLRRRRDGSAVLQGRNRLCRRRREFRGPGRHELCQVCRARGHLVRGSSSRQHDVAVSDRPDQGDAQHSVVAERQRFEAHGETHLEEISVLCSDTNKVERVPASAMFIFIGALPRTDWLADVVERDERGFHPDRPRSDSRRQRPKAGRSTAILSCSRPMFRAFCRGRCAPRFGEARRFRRRRRIGGGAVHPSVFEQGINGRKIGTTSRPGVRRICPTIRLPGSSANRKELNSRRVIRTCARAIPRMRCL
jgi:thioredoxin reductase (NADPH)